MADIKWIKLDIDVFNNRKIKQILSRPKGDTLVVIWLKMLCLAGKLGNSGALMLTSTKPYNIDTLAVEFGYSKPQIKAALEAFKDLELIDVDDGVISMHDWADHQNIDGMDKVRAQTKERQKRFRDKSTALQPHNSNVTDNVTDNVTVTLHNATEEERRKKKEEEDIHSFILSIKGEKSIDGGSVTDDAKKRKYLDGVGKGVVLLSDEQFDDLLDRLSIDEFDRYVGIVADNELSGKHYKRKTHYQAILDMAQKDRAAGR